MYNSVDFSLKEKPTDLDFNFNEFGFLFSFSRFFFKKQYATYTSFNYPAWEDEVGTRILHICIFTGA